MKQRKQKKIVWIVLAFLLLFGLGYVVLFQSPFLMIDLNGNKEVTIKVGEVYKEASARAIYFGKDVSREINVSKVSTKKIGTYTVKYKIKKLFTTKTVTRKILVVDQKAPELTLKGSDVILRVGDIYTEPGYEANDEYDGTLTDKVKVEGTVDTSKVGEYKLTYCVSDESKNKTTKTRKIIVIEKKNDTGSSNTDRTGIGGYANSEMGPKYINGILIVNKHYALPKDYGNGVDAIAFVALQKLQAGAQASGFSMPLLSGYRSYQTQTNLYQRYVTRDGQVRADTYSARAGHSEHQTGLAFDVGAVDDNYGETPGGKWLDQNCAAYGFILRYQKGKESITGYQYEPWHIRYVGEKVAREIMSKGITLEEYLGMA